MYSFLYGTSNDVCCWPRHPHSPCAAWRVKQAQGPGNHHVVLEMRAWENIFACSIFCRWNIFACSIFLILLCILTSKWSQITNHKFVFVIHKHKWDMGMLQYFFWTRACYFENMTEVVFPWGTLYVNTEDLWYPPEKNGVFFRLCKVGVCVCVACPPVMRGGYC